MTTWARWPRPSASTASRLGSRAGSSTTCARAAPASRRASGQLISIARALLADPRILILDEATSNIDRPTEIIIERALDRLLHHRTSLIIAHRLATIRRADEVLVIERGVIVQRGTERDLRAVDGPFRKLAEELAMPASARPRVF